MARITDHRYKGYRVTVSYNLREKAFQIALPPDLKRYGDSVKAISQDMVQREFEKLVDKYKEEGAQREKYILIEIEEGEKNGFVDDNFHRANGLTGLLKVQFVVVERILVNGEYEYHTIPRDRGPDDEYRLSRRGREFYRLGSHMREVAWTQAREDFLTDIVATLTSLSKNIYSFFEEENLARKIDRTKNKLLPNI